MSGYKVIITRTAHFDILELTKYIADVKKNRKAAIEHMEGCYRTISSLSDNPLKYQLSKDPLLFDQSIRFTRFRNYMIAFKVVQETNIVEVYSVLYSASDIPSRLSERLLE